MFATLILLLNMVERPIHFGAVSPNWFAAGGISILATMGIGLATVRLPGVSAKCRAKTDQAIFELEQFNRIGCPCRARAVAVEKGAIRTAAKAAYCSRDNVKPRYFPGLRRRGIFIHLGQENERQ